MKRRLTLLGLTSALLTLVAQPALAGVTNVGW